MTVLPPVTTPAFRPTVYSFPSSGGWDVAGVSRTGSRRETNEDRWLVVPAAGWRPLLVAVADGVGGEAGGEYASAAALAALQDAWQEWQPLSIVSDREAEVALERAAHQADAAVRDVQGSHPALGGSATTLTAAVVTERSITIVHAGDSRAYSLSGTVATPLTQDHTWVAEAVDRGEITPQEATRHRLRNVITRFLGSPEPCVFDVYTVSRAPEECLLLCTDGTSNVIPDTFLAGSEVSKAVTNGVAAEQHDPAHPPATAVATHVKCLLSLVEDRAGADDATIVAVYPVRRGSSDPFGLEQAQPRPGHRRRRMLVAGAGIAAAGTVALAGGVWVSPQLANTNASLRKPPPEVTGERYLALWQQGAYQELYPLVSRRTRESIDAGAFVRRHEAIAREMTLAGLTAEIDPTAKWGAQRWLAPAEVLLPFTIAYATTRFGEIKRRSELRLIWEDRRWAIDWSPTVILPELSSGRLVRAFTDTAVRGSILDTRGRPLAVTAGALTEKRSYPQGNAAGPLVGYVGEVSAEELQVLASKGYLAGEMLGKTGVEAAGEDLLSGQRGGRLTTIQPNGDIAATLASVPPRPGETISLTIDLDLQREVEAILGQRQGSALVLDPRAGAVRVLASAPRYDPNAFVASEGVTAILNDPGQPLINRPLAGQYPPGSTFKVVTMAAGLESGLIQPATEFTCTGRWSGLPGLTFECWLKSGHGTLNLVDGLTHSCNTVFYEVGRRLDEMDAAYLPAFAARAGFGQTIDVLPKHSAAGVVPSPLWKQQALRDGWARGDSVNLAIGQGHLQVTPLQMASVYAGIATNGRVPPLRLLDRAVLPGGNVERRLPTALPRPLGWSPATFEALQTGLRNVVGAPHGTAAHIFAGSPLASLVSGKTGTAESGPGRLPHAWFACYAPSENPRAVVLVMLEHGGEGSGAAAPLARRILEVVLDRM
jgi:penicillin-binding protein 2